jgi:membrane-associated phospholipid phosphatase
MVGLKKMPLIKKALILSCPFALAVWLLIPFDQQIYGWIRGVLPVVLDEPLSLISKWGMYLPYAVFFVLAVHAVLKKRKDIRAFCISYALALLIFGFALVRCLKVIVGRGRPKFGGGFTFMSFDFHHNSFPSGHAADALISGLFLYWVLRESKYSQYRFLPLAYALCMAALRVITCIHFPSDVMAGIGIGVIGTYVMLSLRPYSPPNRPSKP